MCTTYSKNPLAGYGIVLSFGWRKRLRSFPSDKRVKTQNVSISGRQKLPSTRTVHYLAISTSAGFIYCRVHAIHRIRVFWSRFESIDLLVFAQNSIALVTEPGDVGVIFNSSEMEKWQIH